MPKPDPEQILKDATKLKDDRFKQRDADLLSRAAERFNETRIDVPAAYDKTGFRPKPKIIEDEGRQVATLVYAMPVPHVTPPTPQEQPQTTTEEKFLIALHQEAENVFGPVWWQSTLAQIHDNISWDYWGWRKVPYKGQPEPPVTENMEADEGTAATADWAIKNDRFKKDEGVRSFLDYRHLPTGTAHPVGNVYDPDRFYEIKNVAERDLMDTYGITRNSDGSYSAPTKEPSTMPSGTANASESPIRVVEYWDREWCMIVADQKPTWFDSLRGRGRAFVLAEWQHGWGRVPYFASPAIVTEQTAEDKKYIGPLDGIYTEMPEHKLLKVMGHSVAYQTAFAPLVVTSKETGDVILDDAGQPKVFVEFEPGKGRQLAPGQDVKPLGQSPEVANLFRTIAASDAQIAHYSMPAVTKGESPGADTANAALSNLHRFNLTMLDPLAQQKSRQASAMYRFALERIKEMKERVFVFDSKTDSYLSLAAEDIVSVNVEAKVVPDQGQFQLLIEKHAAELKQMGLITTQMFFEMIGKENPEEYELELYAEQVKNQLMPIIQQQIISDLGMLDAVKQMIAANQQTGSARDAVPGLMGQVGQMNPPTGAPGMGQGARGQPRTEGVRSPAVQTTTRPQLTGGA